LIFWGWFNVFSEKLVKLAEDFVFEISDHQQSWGYEEGPSKGPEPCSAGDR
jgi:hypothetical protein